MGRRLNIKFLLISGAAVVLLVGGVYLLHAYQVKRSAGFLLEQGLRAEEDDPARALDLLRQYLAFRPEDDEARVRFGLLLAERARSPQERYQALTVLEQVLGRLPDRHDLRRRAVEIRMELGLHKEAREDLVRLLDGPFRDDAALEEFLARCYIADKEYAKADEAYARAARHAPDRIEIQVARADLLRDQIGDSKQAEQVLDDLIAANEGSYRGYLARARHRTQAGRGPDAAEDVARALALAPEEADVCLAAADVAIAAGKLDEAREHLGRGIERRPHDARCYRALANLEIQAGRTDAAEDLLSRGIASLAAARGGPADGRKGRREEGSSIPGQGYADQEFDLNWSLAELRLAAGKVDEAEKVRDELRKSGLRPELSDYLDASILVAKGQWADAAAKLEKARFGLATLPGASYLTIRANLLQARCYEKLGNPEQQHEAYRRALELDPKSVAGRLGAAATLAALGKRDEAIARYRDLARDQPDARLDLARLLIQRAQEQPADPRRWQEATDALDAAEKAAPGTLAAAILRAEVLAAQGQLDRARAVAEEARGHHPESAEPWLILAALAERQGKPQDVPEVLGRAQEQLGDRAAIRLARAAHRIRHDGTEALAGLAELEQDLEAIPAGERPELLNGLAAAHLTLGDLAGAERLWTRVAEERPGDLATRLILFDLAMHDGREGDATRALDDIRRLEDGPGTPEVEGSLWRFARALQLIGGVERGRADARSLEEARTLLAEVARLRPNWSRVTRALARISDLTGDVAGAIAGYQRAVDLGERDPRTIGRLVQLLYQRRQYADADAALRKLQPQQLQAGGLQQLAAQVSLQAHDYDRAQELASRGVPADTMDYRSQMWLGQMLWASRRGPDEKAEAALRRAVSLAETNPAPWVALVQYLAATDRRPEAEAATREAEAKLPPDQAPLGLAQCYRALGQRDRAEAQYKKALEARPVDDAALREAADFYMSAGQFPQAEPLFREMIEHGASPADAAWARRNLAIGLVSSNGGRASIGGRAEQALDLVEQNLRADAGSIPDQRARALVLAMIPDRRREGLRLLEDLASRQVPTGQEQFLLAQLYEAERDWPKARQQMQTLLTDAAEDPRYPDYLAYYTRGLLRRGAAGEAQVWFNKLAAREPESPRVLELRARLLAATGRGDEAAKLLQGHAADKDAAQVRAVATLLEDLGQHEAAEASYRKYVDLAGRPEHGLVLAMFLARRDRAPEALDLCELAWEACPPDQVATASASVLFAAEAGEEERRRVARRIEAALREDPEDATLMTTLGAVRGQQNQYQEAMELYRRAIARDPRNAAALNNLAYLLAAHDGKARAEEALEYVGRAIEISGPTADLLDTRAFVQMALGRGGPAIKDLEAATAINPQGIMYYHLASAYAMVGDYRSAEQAMREAKTRDFDPARLDRLERPGYNKLVGTLARQ